MRLTYGKMRGAPFGSRHVEVEKRQDCYRSLPLTFHHRLVPMEASQRTTLEPPIKQPLDPLFAIWTQPRATIHRVVDRPALQVMLIAVLVGIYNAINSAHSGKLGDLADPLLVLVLAIGIGATVLGIPLFYLTAWVIERTGRFLGGTASGKELRAAVAWANVPTLMGLVLFALQLPFYREELFLATTPRIDADLWLQLGEVGFVLLRLALGLWGAVIIVLALAEMQGFSVWRSIGNLVLSILVLLALGALLVVPVALLLR